MRKRLLVSRSSLLGLAILGAAACSKTEDGTSANGGQGGSTSNQGGSTSPQGGSTSPKGGSTSNQGGSSQGGSTSPQGGSTSPQGGSDGGCKSTALNGTPVLIDDMETTDHGPIQLTAGISAPLSPGYWYNSGANYAPAGGGGGGVGNVIDTSDPPQGSFKFSALPQAATTLDCNKVSAHAAHQHCVLHGLYDTCGVGFEFAQKPDTSSGGAGSGGAGSGGAATGGSGTGGAGTGVGGDGGAGGAESPPIPMTTVPFDISRYKAVTFWGMTTSPDPTKGSLRVKIQFPDTDTDPRGQVCNGGGPNNSRCYNSYGAYFEFTTNWQQFTVLLDPGVDKVPPPGGIAIDPSWGYQQAQWLPKEVYGISWQAQKDTAPDAGPPLTTDIWIDDVYFVE